MGVLLLLYSPGCFSPKRQKVVSVPPIGYWYGKNRQRFGSKLTQVVELWWLNLVRNEFFVWFVGKCVWVVTTIVQFAQTKEHNVNVELFTSMSLIHYTLNSQEKLQQQQQRQQQQQQQQQQNHEKEIKVKNEY